MSWCCSCFAKTYEAPEVLELDYRHSSLTEVPPDVFTYERTLEKLDLGCNQISDLPPSLFHCHELRELDLCDNDLMSIPPAIGSLTRLAKLDLSRNAIADIADAVKSCKSLTYLDLSLNHLQKLPEGISQLVNLEELFLNDTYLEFLHANFGRLTKLRVLELRENSLQTLPKSMTRLNHMQRIDIGQNDIFELPEVVGTMTNLVELWCDNNSIRSLPKFIGNLTKLNCLDASQNDIQEISEEISKCVQLSDVTLASNSLESLPDSFPKLENLTVLRLDSNSIQYLPEDIGNLKNLTELSLIRNLLKSVPASIGLMRKLQTLYLDDNLLAELPKEIGSCTALSILSVGKNRLVTIPSEIGHLSNLKVLTVAGNLLVHLPVSILNIAKLDALWLSESQSKPLLPLNKEIDPSTGQHVLTCYLLPQLPSSQISENEIVETNDDDTLPPRRSRPSIKFLTDADPQPTDNNLSKRGLLRAPTPYPKELRALAKHASNLRSKDQNGDLVINDEPEYEGDYLIEDENVVDSAKENIQRKNSNSANGGMFYGSHQQHQQQRQPALPVKDYREEDPGPGSGRNSYHRSNSNSNQNSIPNSRSHSNSSAVPGPQTPLLLPSLPPDVSNILSSIEESNKRSEENLHLLPPATNISLIEPCPTLSLVGEHQQSQLSSDDSYSKKGPPPYHVAARRAAFFRSTPSSSSSPVGPPSPLANLDHGPPKQSPVFPTKPAISHLPQQQQQAITVTRGNLTGDPSASNNYVNVNNKNVNMSNYIPSVNIPGINSGSGDNHSMGFSGSALSEDNKLPGSIMKESQNQNQSRHLPGISWSNSGCTQQQQPGLHHNHNYPMDTNLDAPHNSTTISSSEHVMSESEIRIMEEVITETINSATGGKRKMFTKDSTEKTTSVSSKVEEMENERMEVKKQEHMEDIQRKTSNTVQDFKDNNYKGTPDFVSTIEGENEKSNNRMGTVPGSELSGIGSGGSISGQPGNNRGNLNNWTSSIMKDENVIQQQQQSSANQNQQTMQNLQNIQNNFNLSNSDSSMSTTVSKKQSSGSVLTLPSGLSLSESFSKIPVLSPTKIPTPPSLSTINNQTQITSKVIPEVPHFQIQQFQQPIINSSISSSSTSTNTKISQPQMPIQIQQQSGAGVTAAYGSSSHKIDKSSSSSMHERDSDNNNANNSATLTTSSSSWSRIPKPPISVLESSSSNLNSSSISNANVNASVNFNVNPSNSGEVPSLGMGKKPEVGPKPSGIRMTSGSRIPGAHVVNQFMETKISKPSATVTGTALPSLVPTSNLHASPAQANLQLQSQITSPTSGGSRIPRFGEQMHQQQAHPQQHQPQQQQTHLQQHQIQQQQTHPQQHQIQQQQQQQQQYQYHHFQQQQQPSPQQQQPEPNVRVGSRIPKFNEKPKSYSYEGEPETERLNESFPQTTELPAISPAGSSVGGGGSRIPTVAGRKPWIFGTHRNARVVAVEYNKLDSLGFSVSDIPLGSNAGDGSGIYVDAIDASDSTVKIGDKILQVDGIDVSNMNIEIVRKILSNCQDTIHLLVSRHY